VSEGDAISLEEALENAQELPAGAIEALREPIAEAEAALSALRDDDDGGAAAAVPEAQGGAAAAAAATAPAVLPAPSVIVAVQCVARAELALGACIGSGTFSDVYRAVWRGETVAAKQIRVQMLTAEQRRHLVDQEVGMLARLRHPRVLNLLGVCETDAAVFLLTELMARSLHDLLHSGGAALSVDRQFVLALDVASAMRFLHLSHISHRCARA